MTTILITVEGGVVQAIESNGPVQVHLIDIDNIEAGDSAEDCREPTHVDVQSKADFDLTFENAIKEAKEREPKNT